MLKYHEQQTSVSIYCELLSIFYCDLLGWLNNGGSWVNMHWPMTHVTHPKSDPFDPLTHEPSTHCLLWPEGIPQVCPSTTRPVWRTPPYYSFQDNGKRHCYTWISPKDLPRGTTVISLQLNVRLTIYKERDIQYTAGRKQDESGYKISGDRPKSHW